MDEALLILCDLARRKCKITWNDDDTDTRVMEMVENAVPTMIHKLGMGSLTAEEFLKPGLVKTLFENYCLYDWNNMVNEFDRNYREDILTARHRYEVMQNGETQ